ncbi:MAG: hypothetical protein N2314_01030 [Brevinematales bacterium]|nr:hypothetical protein [Brevinematales bacterium]
MRDIICCLLSLVFFLPLFGNPFGGIEVEQQPPLSVETEEYAPIREKTHFRAFRWGDIRATVLQKEEATFFTNVLQQEGLLITLFRQEGRKWFSFLRQEIFIGYVFENNKLVLGYYLVPLTRFQEATNTYERIKNAFFQQYSDKASYSIGLINPPYGDLEGVLAFVRWKTTNTIIELTLERDKILLDPKTQQPATIPFVIVMSYTDVKQQDRLLRAPEEHP